MPRHRLERAPSLRTLWTSAELLAGRVRTRAAGARRLPPRHVRPGSGERWVLAAAMRGLIVSPWFAAGAGFVLATGVVIYSPHARLQLGSATTVTHCNQAGCTAAKSKGGPPRPDGAGGPLVTGKPAQSAATAGLTFSYHVAWQSGTGFGMVITVHGHHALGPWRLAFVIPGATHLMVQGAHWQPAGPDGGTASFSGLAVTDPDPLFGQRSGDLGADTAQFYVNGTGAPHAPTSCVYDGAPCHLAAS